MIRNENHHSTFGKRILTFFFYFARIVDDNLEPFLFDLVHHYYSTWRLKINWWSHDEWLEKILITMIFSSNNHFLSSFHATRIIISYKKTSKEYIFLKFQPMINCYYSIEFFFVIQELHEWYCSIVSFSTMDIYAKF